MIGASLGEPYKEKYLAIGQNIVYTCRKVHTSRSDVCFFIIIIYNISIICNIYRTLIFFILQQGVFYTGLPLELFFITDDEDVFNPKFVHGGKHCFNLNQLITEYIFI